MNWLVVIYRRDTWCLVNGRTETKGELFRLLGYYAAQVGLERTFQDYVSVPKRPF